MSAIIQGYQLRTIAFGVQITKAAQNLPQTATATLATVAGGSVLVTSMIGVVSTAIQNQACNLSLGTVPTTGTASSTGLAAVASISNKEVGTMIVPLVSAGVGGTLVVGANAGASVFLPTPFVVSAGTISWTTSASNTGQMKWYFTYVPLDNGAALS
jgi:hypothetical protein